MRRASSSVIHSLVEMTETVIAPDVMNQKSRSVGETAARQAGNTWRFFRSLAVTAMTAASHPVIPARVAAAREESRVFAIFLGTPAPANADDTPEQPNPRSCGILRAPDTRENDECGTHPSFRRTAPAVS
jgi:hypothetical protein